MNGYASNGTGGINTLPELPSLETRIGASTILGFALSDFEETTTNYPNN
jgi:hypothetical protein